MEIFLLHSIQVLKCTSSFILLLFSSIAKWQNVVVVVAAVMVCGGVAAQVSEGKECHAIF